MLFSQPKERQNKMGLIKQMSIMTNLQLKRRKKKIQLSQICRSVMTGIYLVCMKLITFIVKRKKEKENFMSI